MGQWGDMLDVACPTCNWKIHGDGTSSNRTIVVSGPSQPVAIVLGIILLYDMGLQLGLKVALEVEVTAGLLVGGRRFIHGFHSISGASPCRWAFKWDSVGTC